METVCTVQGSTRHSQDLSALALNSSKSLLLFQSFLLQQKQEAAGNQIKTEITMQSLFSIYFPT